MIPPLFDKQEVGIWRVQKRFPRYGVPIWSLWQNIRFLPSIVAEKNVKEGRPDRWKDERTDGQRQNCIPPSPSGERGYKYKQWSTKHCTSQTPKATRTPGKIGGELMCFGRMSSSYSTSHIRHVTLVNNQLISHVTLVNNQLISHEKGKKEGIVTMTKETYPLSSVNECKWKYLF